MYYRNYKTLKKFMRLSSFVPLSFGLLFSAATAIVLSYLYIDNTPPIAEPVYYGHGEVVVVDSTESTAKIGEKTITLEIVNGSEGDIVGVYQDNNWYTNNPNGHSASASSLETITALFVLITIAGAALGYLVGYSIPAMLQRKWFT